MLEEKDIQKLIEVFATREEINQQFGDFREEMKGEFSKLHTAIDIYAKKVEVLAQEMVMLAHKVDRHEKWIKQLADKLGVKLEY